MMKTLCFATTVLVATVGLAAEPTTTSRRAQKAIDETIAKLKAKQTTDAERVALLAAVGELGSDAAPVLPFLLSDEFYKNFAQKNPAKSLPLIDGKELDLNLQYNYKSPYMVNKVGSDIVTVKYGKRTWEYDFGENTITEIPE